MIATPIEVKRTPAPPIEPDNDMCCQHFQKVINEGKLTAFEASCGSLPVDIKMKERLDEIFEYINNGSKRRQ